MRSFERERYLPLEGNKNNNNFEAEMILSSDLKKDFENEIST